MTSVSIKCSGITDKEEMSNTWNSLRTFKRKLSFGVPRFGKLQIIADFHKVDGNFRVSKIR